MTGICSNKNVCRSVVMLLSLAMVSLGCAPAFARSTKSPDASMIKAKVKKLGVGEHVMVKLATGEKLHGHIMSIDEQSQSQEAWRG